MNGIEDISSLSGKTVFVLGGDGFCGWPAALRFSQLGARVTILDNGSRRRIDAELGTKSATPILSLQDRVRRWQLVADRRIDVLNIELASDFARIVQALGDLRPEVVVHFAEQRSAPYSMMSSAGARYSVDTNIRVTHNLLAATVESRLDPHLVHMGTMGVYGYSTAGLQLPEGYLTVRARGTDGREVEKEILYPGKPDSVYHLTKVLDQQMCAFYAGHYGLRITELHQGVVWATQSAETQLDAGLVNRYDTDPIYGTVVNRFLLQAFEGRPLTVYGSGSQARAFIHIEDMLACITQVALRPPATGSGKLHVVNQFGETSSVNAIARQIQRITGAEIAHLANPRIEPEANEFDPDRSTLGALGLHRRTFASDLGDVHDGLTNLLRCAGGRPPP